MKPLQVLLILLLAGTATAQVSQTEVKAAKMKYINGKKKMLTDTSAATRETMRSDSVYYEGLRAIRHDQKIPAFLRKKS